MGVTAENQIEVRGRCDTRFAAVKQAFADNFSTRGEPGAAVAISLSGRPVVDLWGGWADSARTKPWAENTLVNVFSVGKAITTICALQLVERGVLDLDVPIARYWREFS